VTDRGVRREYFYLWLAVAGVSTWLMWVSPGNETIPYHAAWAAFALLYGIGSWGLGRAVTGLALYTVATGSVLVSRAAGGVIDWQETVEIPLMSLLMVLMVWHVRRRQIALAAITVMAQREREQAHETESLTRLTSHEMRTPLTIARGYVELLLGREQDVDQVRDLGVVADELARLTRVTERLVRVIRLQGGGELESVDLDAMLHQTADRWAPVADRHWVVQAQAGLYEGSAERMRASLDTLIENALRYTRDGDTVRLTGIRTPDGVVVGVADSGAGMSAEQIAVINGLAGAGAQAPRDELSQTGLGLGLVRGLVAARGGRLVAGQAPEGGALVLMQIPARPLVVPAPEGPAPAEPARRDGRQVGDPTLIEVLATETWV
jgi:two-component system OmpR family sensor kinase